MSTPLPFSPQSPRSAVSPRAGGRAAPRCLMSRVPAVLLFLACACATAFLQHVISSRARESGALPLRVAIMRTRAATDEGACKGLASTKATACAACPTLPVAPAAPAGDKVAADTCPDYVPAHLRPVDSADTGAASDDVLTVAVIFGTRPEAIKLAPVVHFLRLAAASKDWTTRSVRVVAIATGQHAAMLSQALSALALEPDVVMSLMVADQDMASLTARSMAAVGCALQQLRPTLVLVQGDTVTAAAAGMAAFLRGIPVGHVEAGLRTFLPLDPFPEEVLRTSLSSFATLHFAPTQYAADVLLAAGVCPSKIHVVGNTVVDSLLSILKAGPSDETLALQQRYMLPASDYIGAVRDITGEGGPRSADAGASRGPADGPPSLWLIVTMHRRESFGTPMRNIAAAVRELVESLPALHVLLPVHPNPKVRSVVTEALSGLSRVHIVDPMPYDTFVFVLASADAVLTDSGGLQEESIALGKRLFIMRQTSERPEALQSGRATLVGTARASILHHVGAWGISLSAPVYGWQPPSHPDDAGSTADESVDSSSEGLGPVGENLFPVSSALSGDGSSSVLRPGSRLVFGDGLASARITRAALNFMERYSTALRSVNPDVETLAALRVFMSCGHASSAAASLAGAPRLADHYFHDFTWHGRDFAAGHERLRQRIECSSQAAPRPVANRTYEEIAALESFYEPSERGFQAADFGVTIIVSVFRRPQTFLRLLWALGNQTVAPVEVWVTTFNSKFEDEFRAMIRGLNPAIFKFISGDPNLKYFGRFALANMVKTPYVALFDDDCIPGAGLLAQLLHMINVKSGEFNGLLGMKGHGNVAEEQGTNTLANYWVHWVYKGQTSVKVDLTGGVWFLRSTWVRQMWREEPVPIEEGPLGPWQTGEDFQLTYSLKKFLGLDTYLFPQPYGRPDLWGQSTDYLDISRAGDTTDVTDILARRQVIFHGLLQKGYTPARADTVWGEAWNRTNIAIVVSTLQQASALSGIVRFLRSHFDDVMRVHVVLATPPLVRGRVVAADGLPEDAFGAAGVHPAAFGAPEDTRAALLAALGVRVDVARFELGVWDLSLSKLGRHARWRAIDLMTETEQSLAGVLETLRPAAVILPYGRALTRAHGASSPIVTGVAMAVAAMGIPALGLDVSAAPESCEEIVMSLQTGTVAAERSASLCAPLNAVSYATGPVAFVTNSEALLVQTLFDTLCTCERASSSGVGAFSRCPDIGSRFILTEFRALSLFAAAAPP